MTIDEVNVEIECPNCKKKAILKIDTETATDILMKMLEKDQLKDVESEKE